MRSSLHDVPWREIGRLVRRERVALVIAVVCALIAPAAALVLPFAVKIIIDQVLGHGQRELLVPVALGTAVAVAIQAAAAFGAAQAAAVAGGRMVARLRQRLHRHVLGLTLSVSDTVLPGAFVSRIMADVDQLRAFFGPAGLQLVSNALAAGLALAVLLATNPSLAIAMALGLLIFAVGLSKGLGSLQATFGEANQIQTTLAGRLTEMLSAMRTVRACTAERREALAFAQGTHNLLRAALAADTRVSTLVGAIALGTGVLSLGLVVLGGQAVAHETMTLGDLALFVFLIGLVSTPVVQLAGSGAELGRAAVALTRIGEVLSMTQEPVNTSRPVAPTLPLKGAVTFEGVSYTYKTGRQPALRHISLHAPEGASVAVLGPNGAGKSTLIHLLLAFDAPTSGQILLDGHPITAFPRRPLRRNIAAVMQQTELLAGTIRENIHYGRPGASRVEFLRAVRLAHCDEFVSRLPEGYDTLLGQRGMTLSGGQRQRVALARAFLMDPRLLLLDEATTHLDWESEALIQDAVTTLCKGRTSFVIAHRPETVREASQILLLDDGAVVERGTHDELMANREGYWRFMNAQDNLYRPGRVESRIHAC